MTIDEPWAFAQKVLGLKLYPWQDTILGWYLDPRIRTKGSVVAPNGSGKDDRVIATLALWWAAVHPEGQVVITSKDSRQLDEQTMRSLHRHRATFPDWKFNERTITTNTGGKIIGFTTDDAGRAEGWHPHGGPLNGPVMIIVNEAKSVPDDIYYAFDRCTFNAMLYISSAGLMSGRFYDSHTKDAAQFKRKVVTIDECPHLRENGGQERILDLIATHGEKSWFVRSTLYSEFISEDDSKRFIFSLPHVQQAMKFAPVFQRDLSRSAFCDFAAGGDENVLALRDGNTVKIIDAWREKDTMSACGRFIQRFMENGLKAEEIYGDNGGLGGSVIDRMWELGWRIHRVNNNGAPRDAHYKNLVAEMWGETAAAVANGNLGLPDDAILLAQLTTRPVKIWSDGKVGLMSKPDMKDANLPSPDRADAVCGAWTCRGPILSAFDRRSPWTNDSYEEIEIDVPAGMHAG